MDETEFGAAIDGRGHAIVDNLGAAAPWPAAMPDRPATVVPLATADTMHGLLVMVAGVGERVDAEEDLAMLTQFAGQAALAFERALAQEEREMFVILEDRERIARDLHDVVIQRLFATGMQLQTAARLARPEVADRVNAAVDALDTTIRDIRSAIFELRSPVRAELRVEIREVVGAAADQLGFRPALELSGPLDSAVPAELRADLVAVLREALSNVVRHAGASTVHVTIRLAAGTVIVEVADDGAGVPADGQTKRAEQPARPRVASGRHVRGARQRSTRDGRGLAGTGGQALGPPSSLVANTAAWVRRSRPSLASRLDT